MERIFEVVTSLNLYIQSRGLPNKGDYVFGGLPHFILFFGRFWIVLSIFFLVIWGFLSMFFWVLNYSQNGKTRTTN